MNDNKVNGRVPPVDEEFDCRLEAENRFAIAVYGDTQSGKCACSAWTLSSSIFARTLHVHEARRYNHG